MEPQAELAEERDRGVQRFDDDAGAARRFDNRGIVAALIKQGKLKALGIASTQRLTLLPDTPTLKEQGIELEFVAWAGLFAPAGTPKEIVARLNQESVKALGMPDVKERLAGLGFETYGTTPERFSETIRTDLARIGKAIKDASITYQPN